MTALHEARESLRLMQAEADRMAEALQGICGCIGGPIGATLLQHVRSQPSQIADEVSSAYYALVHHQQQEQLLRQRIARELDESASARQLAADLTWVLAHPLRHPSGHVGWTPSGRVYCEVTTNQQRVEAADLAALVEALDAELPRPVVVEYVWQWPDQSISGWARESPEAARNAAGAYGGARGRVLVRTRLPDGTLTLTPYAEDPAPC